ncbi:hypothetical protein [Staphylococcus nepalensis]|uniref:hypothetical protein n=1 Tax=Staphylococcus nepalensis TaxID=214473 RepID=UPI001C3FE5F7|nr:hypothetical protein [Staphylococcus nepalensis]
MAYEYESRLKNRLLDLEFDTWEETVQFEREYRELERVYRKAKAWNNYLLSVEEDAKNEFGDNEALVNHAVELNKKIFMEDE